MYAVIHRIGRDYRSRLFLTTRFETAGSLLRWTDCRKKGSVKTLALLEELAAGRDDVIVEKADMSHTEHGCFECGHITATQDRHAQ